MTRQNENTDHFIVSSTRHSSTSTATSIATSQNLPPQSLLRPTQQQLSNLPRFKYSDHDSCTTSPTLSATHRMELRNSFAENALNDELMNAAIISLPNYANSITHQHQTQNIKELAIATPIQRHRYRELQPPFSCESSVNAENLVTASSLLESCNPNSTEKDNNKTSSVGVSSTLSTNHGATVDNRISEHQLSCSLRDALNGLLNAAENSSSAVEKARNITQMLPQDNMYRSDSNLFSLTQTIRDPHLQLNGSLSAEMPSDQPSMCDCPGSNHCAFRTMELPGNNSSATSYTPSYDNYYSQTSEENIYDVNQFVIDGNNHSTQCCHPQYMPALNNTLLFDISNDDNYNIQNTSSNDIEDHGSPILKTAPIVETLSFQWDVSGFRSLRKMAQLKALPCKDRLISRQFGNQRTGFWHLALFPYAERDTRRHVSVYVFSDDVHRRRIAEFRLVILNQYGEEISGTKLEEKARIFTPDHLATSQFDSSSWGWHEYLSVMNEDALNQYLHHAGEDDTLSIKATITTFLGIEEIIGVRPTMEVFYDFYQKDKKLWKNEVLSLHQENNFSEAEGREKNSFEESNCENKENSNRIHFNKALCDIDNNYFPSFVTHMQRIYPEAIQQLSPDIKTLKSSLFGRHEIYNLSFVRTQANRPNLCGMNSMTKEIQRRVRRHSNSKNSTDRSLKKNEAMNTENKRNRYYSKKCSYRSKIRHKHSLNGDVNSNYSENVLVKYQRNHLTSEGTFSRHNDAAISQYKQNLPNSDALVQLPYTPYHNYSSPSLAEDIKSFLQGNGSTDNNIRDIDLICTDGNKVSANRFILMSRSPVFRMMFSLIFNECKREIKIPINVSVDAVTAFIEFMETDQCKLVCYNKITDSQQHRSNLCDLTKEVKSSTSPLTTNVQLMNFELQNKDAILKSQDDNISNHGHNDVPTIKRSVNYLLELLELSDFYITPKLYDLCTKMLIRTLSSTESIKSIHKVAKRLQCKILLKSTNYLIHRNPYCSCIKESGSNVV